MKKVVRFVMETIGKILSAGLLLLLAVTIIRHVFDDEKIQFFAFGYYMAFHHKVAPWVWRRIGLERAISTI